MSKFTYTIFEGFLALPGAPEGAERVIRSVRHMNNQAFYKPLMQKTKNEWINPAVVCGHLPAT
jgi:hypothetical protein